MNHNDRQVFGELLKAVLDVYGSAPGVAGVSIWWAALERFPLDAVRAALSAHVQDAVAGKFAPKPADVIGRLHAMDGRPGPEEAWSMIPRDEAASVVWTQEMAQAWGTARLLLDEGDQVAARMAFLERYRQLVQGARDKGEPAKWMPSLGFDQSGREAVLIEARDRGRLTAAHVAGLLPQRDEQSGRTLALIQKRATALPAQESTS